MGYFDHIIGHGIIKKYFEKALINKRVAHSYIFEGPYGVGRKSMAKSLAKALLCENEDKPCGVCKSCKQLEADTHPDVIYVTKDTKVTKIDRVREQVVKYMEIKPYSSPYKVAIIEEAETLNIEAQNALLKTIEEPPEYGIIILITQNIETLLPTIRSRCIHIRFSSLHQDQIEEYLEYYPINSENKLIYIQFCQGSIGKINDLVKDETFMNKRKKSIDYLLRLQKADLIQLYDLVKEIIDDKENIEDLLNFWILWYRDLAIYKSMQKDNLYYLDYKTSLIDIASNLTYNKISSNLEILQQSQKAIKQNVNVNLIIENLLLKLKERRK